MALKGKRLGFYYNRKSWLFRGVDFELENDEVVGICGQSGCGKTSFARVMANYLQPMEGEVTCDAIDGESLKKGRYQPVQLIHQHPEKSINPKWKMRDVLTEGYTPDRETLERLGIKDEWMERYPIELSGGELQRFCIARALSQETRYIIADEMTTMLDAITQAKIWSELLDICKERGIGLALISHEAALIERLCTRTVNFD